MAITEIASGIGGQLVGLAETTFGVAPTFTSPVSWEYNSETLKLTKSTVQGRGLHAGGRFDRSKRRVVTNYEAGGGIDMDLPSRNLNLLLKAMMGSADQTVYTSNGTLTTNAETPTPTYTAVHIPGSNIGYSICLQKAAPAIDGTIEPFTYVGCKVMDWTISVASNQLAKLALTIDARNELGGAGNSDPLNGSVPSLATWTNTPMDVFHFREATLLMGGTAATTSHVTSVTSGVSNVNVTNASVKVSNPIANKRFNLGSSGFKLEQVDNGFRTISGSFDAEWLSSETMYNAFSADTPTALQLNFAGAAIGSGSNVETLNILIPNIKLDGESPQVSGPGIVSQKVTFSGLDDETNNPIQIKYTTLDAT